MSASNRSTNGHRFVFHSLEVNASERHHIAGEPGVIPYHPPPPLLCPAVGTMPSSMYPSSTLISGSPTNTGEYHYGQNGQYPGPFTSHPLDMDEGDSDEWSIRASSPPIPGFDPVPTGTQSPPRLIQQPTPPLRSPSPLMGLKAGDVLYWHHLSRHGEIPGVQEDPRARRKGLPRRLSPGVLLEDGRVDDGTSVRVTGMAVACGR